MVVCLLCSSFFLARTTASLVSSKKADSSKPCIMLDAGHGGADPGKVGCNDILEKDLNLAIVYKLKTLFENKGFRVVLTRTDDKALCDENSKDTVWWTSDEYKNDNHPATKEAWEAVKDIAIKELSNKRLFVVDAFCGANKDTRMAIRFIVEVAWQAHFVKNMFIKPTEEELKNFEPDFVVYNASKAKVENYKELGLNSADFSSSFNSASSTIPSTPRLYEKRKSSAFISCTTILLLLTQSRFNTRILCI